VAAKNATARSFDTWHSFAHVRYASRTRSSAACRATQRSKSSLLRSPAVTTLAEARAALAAAPGSGSSAGARGGDAPSPALLAGLLVEEICR
jgi:hypothetical protein